MYKRIPILIFFLLSISFAMSQRVSNITAVLNDNNQLVVNYQLLGTKFNQSFDISLYVSIDDGKSFQGPLESVEGDVGEVEKGGQHQIIWDFLNELPVVDVDFIFDVRAKIIETPIKRKLFVALVGNNITYMGLRVGTVGKVGYYVEARMNLLALEDPAYTFKDSTITDYDKPGYYQFNGDNNWSAYSFIAGATFQPAENLFIYVGAGYGKEYYLYGIDEYSYEDELKQGSAYVKDETNSVEGVEGNVGLMLRLGKVILSGGGTTINGEVFNWTAGIGISF